MYGCTHTRVYTCMCIYPTHIVTVLTKIKIKTRKAASFDEIPPAEWKTRKFDDQLLRYSNAMYNQNTIERWTKGCILPFPKKADFGITKNYRVIILTSIATKIYNALLLNCIKPEIEKIFCKNQNGFRRNQSTTSQISTIRRISQSKKISSE